MSSITGLSTAGSGSWSWGTAHKRFTAGKLGTQLKRLGRSSGHVPELSPSSLFLCRRLALSFDLAGASQRAKSKIQTCLCPCCGPFSHWLTACSQTPESSSLALALQICHLGPSRGGKRTCCPSPLSVPRQQAPEGFGIPAALGLCACLAVRWWRGCAVSACCIHLALAALSVPRICFVMCPCQCSARIKSVSFPCPRSSGLFS